METKILVRNIDGEAVLWLETAEDGTTTINDTNEGQPFDPSTESAYEAAVQWVQATGGDFESPVEIVVSE